MMERLVFVLCLITHGFPTQTKAASWYNDVGEWKEWINDLIDWRGNVAEWKYQIERGCFINGSGAYWTSLFECPDFSEIRCVNQTAGNSIIDSLNCTIAFCEDGRYTNKTALRMIYRGQSDMYKKIIGIHKEDLIQCRERTCAEAVHTTSVSPNITEPETTDVSSTAPAESVHTTNQLTEPAITTISPTVTEPATTDVSSTALAEAGHTTNQVTEPVSTFVTESESTTVPLTAAVTRSSCDGAEMESALERTDSGGVFQLNIPGVGVRNVSCDVTDDGGNWTVFQRRMNGKEDFYRDWNDYVNGFGDLREEHWLGLEALHQLTKDGNVELKIKMITEAGVYWVAKYSSFLIGPGSDNYRLHVSGYSGNATGDALAYHNNRQFTTKDADHDSSRWNCASDSESGWWHGYCATANLNGNFHKTGNDKGVWWNGSSRVYLRFSEMKIRKRT